MAVRQADRDALIRAKDKAKAAMSGVERVANARCTIDFEAFRKRSEVLAIEKLDRDVLFTADEPERLMYVQDVIRKMPFVPLYDEQACPPLDAERRSVRDATRASYRRAAAKLAETVKGWDKALHPRDGVTITLQ